MRRGSDLQVKIERLQFPSTGIGHAEDKIIENNMLNLNYLM